MIWLALRRIAAQIYVVRLFVNQKLLHVMMIRSYTPEILMEYFEVVISRSWRSPRTVLTIGRSANCSLEAEAVGNQFSAFNQITAAESNK